MCVSNSSAVRYDRSSALLLYTLPNTVSLTADECAMLLEMWDLQFARDQEVRDAECSLSIIKYASLVTLYPSLAAGANFQVQPYHNSDKCN